MGTVIGIGNRIGHIGSRLNPSPPPDEVPEGAIKFEGTDDYVVFENGGKLIYVVFET